ncbi:MAG: sigma-70 family RNA polymerase sigma factor [Solirubrobacteraceae bacterium]
MTVERADSPEENHGAYGFEQHRAHLHAVAYRMLGSLNEADDAVQEAWLRLSRADTGDVRDMRAWLTTVVSRVCLDMLRSRATRREDSLGTHVPDPIVTRVDDDPAEHAVLADSVGIALLVVLDTLPPAERLAFVLHDVFAVPFDQIGPILDRTPAAAKQLASRARQRLRADPAHQGQTSDEGGPSAAPPRASTGDLGRQWTLVNAFLAASRDGDFERLLTILDPDVLLRADAGSGPFGPSVLLHGAREFIAQSQRFRSLGRFAHPVLVNGGPGFLIVRDGEALVVLAITIEGDKVTEMDILADPDRLRRLDLAGLVESGHV